MAIVDYEKRAQREERVIFEDPNISETNKTHLRAFLMVYEVGAARRSIFLRQIRHLLLAFEDVKAQMEDRVEVNRLFYDLRQRYRPASYASIVSVALSFVRWLNDGDKPRGYLDIKGVPKKKTKRELQPGDMVTWEEGLALARESSNMQTRAALLAQLDGGFRPSEFLDLRYGDIRQSGSLAFAFVREGKTGSRQVVLHRCLPQLCDWMNCHPTKRDNDPLWVKESSSFGAKELTPMSYASLRKRIRHLAKRLKFKKPIDLYNLRHSSCTLDKVDNLWSRLRELSRLQS
jgi:integrase